MLPFLLEQSSDSVAQYLSYFKWDYLFIVLAVFGLFGALFAAWRGIYRSSTRYIAFALCVVVLVFTLPSITEYVSAIDLTRFVGDNYGLQVNASDGTQVTVQVTTVDDTVLQLLQAYGLTSGDTSDPAVVQTALALTHSAISLALYVVGLLLTQLIFAPLLGFLLYAITFALFIPKAKRKGKKHRWFSFFEGLVCSTVVGALFISPLTSVASMFADTAKAASKNEDLTESQYGAYIDLFSKYSDSAFYSAVTLGSGDASKALDTALMSKVTETTVNGAAAGLYDIVTSIAPALEQAVTVLDVGDDGNFKIDYDKLFGSKDTVDSMISTLGQFRLLTELLPSLAAMGLSAMNLKDVSIDFTKVDWSSALLSISTVYDELYEPIVKAYVLPSLKKSDGEISLNFDYSQKENFKKGMSALADFASDKKQGKTLMDQIVLPLLPHYAESLNASLGVDAFSTDQADYASIDLHSLFDNLIEIVFDLFRYYGVTSFDADGMKNFSDRFMSSLGFSAEQGKALKPDTDTVEKFLIPLFTGKETTLPAVEGKYEEERVTTGGIDFIKDYLGVFRLGDYLKHMLGSSADEKVRSIFTDDVVSEFTAKLSSADLSKEAGVLLSLIGDLGKIPTDEEGNYDLESDETPSAFRKLNEDLQQSELLKDAVGKILPGIVENAVNSNEDTKKKLEEYGIDLSRFDFNPVDKDGNSVLVKELLNLVDLLPKFKSLFETFGNSSSSSIKETLDKMDEDFQNDLKDILNALVDNKILNPDIPLGDGTSATKSNVNFNAIVEKLLKSDALSSLGLTFSDLSDVQWKDGLPYGEGEITHLVEIVRFLHDNSEAIAQLASSSSDIDYSKLCDESFITKMFKLIGEDQVFGDKFSLLLDEKIGEKLHDSLGVRVNFASVTDWKDEGKKIEKVFRLLNSMKLLKTDSIDFTSLEREQLNKLLTQLARTSLLSVQLDDKGEYVDKLGELLYAAIQKINLPDGIRSAIEPDDFSTVCDPTRGTIKTSFSSWYADLGTTDDGYYYDTNGEIAALSNLFGELKNYDFASAELDPDKVKPIVDHMLDSYIFTSLLVPVLSSTLENVGDISIPGPSGEDAQTLSLSKLNLAVLDSMREDEKKAEIEGNILGIYTDVTAKDSEGKTLLGKLGTVHTGASEETVSSLKSLLTKIASSKVMNTAKQGDDSSFFVELLGDISHTVGLDRWVYPDETSASAKANYRSYLGSITDFGDTAADDGTITEGEISRFMQLLTDLNGVPLNDFSSFSATDLDVKTLLTDINRSEMLHPALPYFFNRIFTGMNLSDMLEGRRVECSVHRTASEEDIAFWENEIKQISSLYDALSGNVSGFSNLKLSDSDLLYNLLNPIDRMELLKDDKSYLVYHLLDSFDGTSGNSDDAILSYVRGYSVQTGFESGNAKAERIKALLFPNGHTEEYLKTQCDILSSYIQSVQDVSSLTFDDSTMKGDAFADRIFDLYMGVMKVEKDEADSSYHVTRSYLGSELLAGEMTDKLASSVPDVSKTAVKSALEGLYYASDPLGADYAGINLLEARGLKGLLSLLKCPSYPTDTSSSTYASDMNGFKAAFLDAFALMGRGGASGTKTTAYSNDSSAESAGDLCEYLSDADLVSAYNYLLDEYETEYGSKYSVSNSRIAYVLFSAYADKVTIYEKGSTSYTVKGMIDTYNAVVKTEALRTSVNTAVSAYNLLHGTSVSSVSESDAIDYASETFETTGEKALKAIAFIDFATQNGIPLSA